MVAGLWKRETITQITVRKYREQSSLQFFLVERVKETLIFIKRVL